MASIDERIVAISFENAKFEAGVAKTIATLAKLNESLKLAGATTGLQDIEKAANKVTMANAASAADKLKGKMEFSGAINNLGAVEGAASKITFGPLVTALENLKSKIHFPGSDAAFGALASAASKVNFGPLGTALETLKSKIHFPGADTAFGAISSAANKVVFTPLHNAIEKLKGAFTFGGAAQKSFAEIEGASGKVRFGGIQNAIGEMGKQFSILEGAASVALGNIATKAISAGAAFGKSFTFGPIREGLKEYTTNLNSIQTILANTQSKGSKLKDVNATLAELNEYSDKTIYNFGEMAKNIGTFTAAGVDLKTATASIKGIANLAALSGSNSQQASTAMYQLSQAIASGKVGLQDWNSVVNAGMGGAVFQKNLADTAIAMGALEKEAVTVDKVTGNLKINGQSFRDSIMAAPGKESWLKSEVLTGSLKTFTGDLTDAQLKAEGFNAAQIKSIQATAKSAQDAATKVKTLGQVFDIAKETMGSGYAKTFQLIFGDFEQAKKTFTSLSNTINGVINKSADARNNLLEGFNKLGGRDTVIKGITNAFVALGSVLKPVGAAFREVFPPTTAKRLFEMATAFEKFTEKLKIGPKTAENLKRTFAGFFAVLHIGMSIVGEIIGLFGKLLGASSGGAGGILSFTGTIGDFLVAVDKAVTRGGILSAFFDGLATILSVPLQLLSSIGGIIGGLFDAFDSKAADGVGSSLAGVGEGLSPLKALIDGVSRAWDGFVDALGKVGDAIAPVMKEIGDIFSNFGAFVSDALAKADFDDVFSVIQTGLIGGIFVVIKKALGGGLNFDFGAGALKGIGDTFGTLNKQLVSMQTSVRAKTILTIALAMATLAAAVAVLSQIDAADLAKAMTAITVGLGQLIAAMAILAKVGGAKSIAMIPLVISINLLAVALTGLAVAVTIFSKLSWGELIKGLSGVGGALVAIAAGVKLIPPSIVIIAPALIAIAVALNLIAVAVKIFGSMKLLELGKGLLGVGGALAAIALGMKAMPPTLLVTAAGLAAVGVALNLIAIAVTAFGSMDLLTLGKGMLGIAGSLTAIGLAIKLIPPTIALQAAGLILVGIALTGIAGALRLMGGMPLATIVKGLAGIGASLVVLGSGLKLMAGTVPGSIALLAAASALAILVPVIGILGKMKFTTIVKGLGAIGLALVVMGAAGAVAAPGLTALGVALVPLGVGLGLIGGALFLTAKGIAILGSDGAKGIGVLIAAITAFIAIMPKVAIDFAKGLVEILVAIAELAPKIVDALARILIALLDVVIKAAPKMAQAFTALLQAGITVITANLPTLLKSGFEMLAALLKGIADNIGRVVTTVGTIIVNFLTALASHIPKLVSAGLTVLVKLLEGITSGMPRMIAAGAALVVKFLTGLAQNIGRVVAAAAELIVKFVNSMASNVGKVISAGANLIVKILEGVASKVSKVTDAAAEMMGDFVEAAAKAVIKLANRVARIIINFLDALAAAIRKYTPEFQRAGGNLVDAIVDGAISTIAASGGKVIRGITGIFKGAIKAAKSALGMNSPSKVFMQIGKYMMDGTIIGVDRQAPAVYKSLESAADGMIKTVVRTLGVVPDILDGLMDMDPVITPVLDLTNVQAEAKKLGDLTNVTPITAAASYDQATSISAAQEVAQTAANDSSEAPTPAEIKFEQHNYSPESLSPAEVYRLTKNQLAQAKDALSLVS